LVLRKKWGNSSAKNSLNSVYSKYIFVKLFYNYP
jgi:hypothetical protein